MADAPQGGASRRPLVLQAALLVGLLLALAWRTAPDGRLRVHFLATAGDAVLIQTPSGGYVLIDGGSDPAALTAALGRKMPFWRRSLDLVVLTLPERARLVGQVAALERYDAARVLLARSQRRSALLSEWQRLLAQGRARAVAARAGQRMPIGGATLRVLSPGDGDEDGMILRLDHGRTSVVFDLAGGERAEADLLAAGGSERADLLVFPWQRDPGTPFVAALGPAAIIFSDGYQADRPARQTMHQRAAGGAELYHEALHGTITLTSDGRTFRVTTEQTPGRRQE